LFFEIIDRVAAEQKWYSNISRPPTGRWTHSIILQSSAYDFITVLDSIIGRLKVFQPDLLDNYVYLQILSGFKQAPLNPAIVINMQQSADGDSGDESSKRPSVLILVRGLHALSYADSNKPVLGRRR
jgi:hypothetical protein